MDQWRRQLEELGVSPSKDYAEAFNDFARLSLEAQTGLPDARLARGEAAIRVGDYQRAFEDARYAMLIDSQNVESLRLMAHAALAMVAEEHGVLTPGPGSVGPRARPDLDRVVGLGRDALRRMLERNPFDPDAMRAQDLLDQMEPMAETLGH